ncbi:MAG: NTP transferase domain-containing protein [Peptococcaceae bacterium]|nr:NTP transferase domain-containing protein [Peptococcaceae bacterium]
MKAFIFNSGRGSRLGALTAETPKALMTLTAGETILSRQLRLLMAAGVRDCIISTGYLAEQIRAACAPFVVQGLRVTFVDNPDYASTNAIVSMHRAASTLQDDDFLIMHGDLVFDEAWIGDVLATPAANLVAISEARPLSDKDFKARLENDRIAEIGVDIFGEACVNLMPFYKLSAASLALWLGQVADYCRRGETRVYAETCAAPVLGEMHLRGFSYAGRLLMEIDTPEDLALARRILADTQQGGSSCQ